jgi:hypothetical protein
VHRATAQPKTGIFHGYEWCSWSSSSYSATPAGSSRLVWLYVFFSLSSFVSVAHLEFPSKFLYWWGYSAVSELSPNVLSGGGRRCLFCCARHFRTANSTPLISSNRNLAPFDKLGWKVITPKCLFQSPVPVYLWAPTREVEDFRPNKSRFSLRLGRVRHERVRVRCAIYSLSFQLKSSQVTNHQ